MTRILAVARREAAKAALDLEELSPGLGERFLDDFEEALARLAAAPNEQPPWLVDGVPEGVRHTMLRRFPHHLIFVLDPDPLVLATRAQRQDPLDWLDRLAT